MTLTELERLARAATPGPWQTEGGMNLYVFTPGNETMIAEARGSGAGLSEEQQSANAQHIAAANPTTVPALLEDLRAAREALGWFASLSEDEDELSESEKITQRRARAALDVQKVKE